MNALIVDDEPLARRRLRTMLGAVPDVVVVGECESAEDALDVLSESEVDVLFLDIQMPGLGGLGLADQLERASGPAVVFVTAHSEHAIHAFDVAAADYLLKPFSKERLHETLERVRAGQEKRQVADLGELVEILSGERYPRRLTIPGRSKVVFVHVATIDRIEADGNYVVIHVGERSHLLRAYLGEMEKRLDPAVFVRVHRSHLVRRDRIVELRTAASGAQSIHLTGGVELPVGRKYAEGLLE